MLAFLIKMAFEMTFHNFMDLRWIRVMSSFFIMYKWVFI